MIQSYKDLIYLKDIEVTKLHNGYFSQDNKRVFKDTSGSTKDDENTYNLIMSDKEKLLDRNNPLRFIFSHTALKEGWDNPNVFQVCMLREVGSEITQRQQIGRGLRLPVNANGDRIHDSSINRLTVIANESYENFARNLQEEFEAEGVKFNREYIKNINQRRTLTLNKKVLLSEDFKILCDKIKPRTRYKVKFSTKDLIAKAVKLIAARASEIKSPSIITTKHQILITAKGIENELLRIDGKNIKAYRKTLPDIITFLQDQTKLVRSTICDILRYSDSWRYFYKNPQAFMDMAAKQINNAMRELIFNEDRDDGIIYEKIDNFNLDIRLINQDIHKEIMRYVTNLYEVTNKDKTLYNFVEYSSDIEKTFTKNLDTNEQVKLFFKLPEWFNIPTPIGTYTLDWAIVLVSNNREKLYLIRETKASTDKKNLRLAENIKVNCGKKHFNAINVDFDIAVNLIDILKNLRIKNPKV